jgi:hypothetical protein
MRAAVVIGMVCGVTWAVLGVSGPPLASAAGPVRQYRIQETTRCMNWQGCPRMLRNAVDHANQFCRGEGGVLKGDQRRDYRCEQRGVYCVVTGRIECRGRFDPTRVPGGADPPPTPPRTRTCLDTECTRFVSHAPGEQERGLHACPPGYLLAGVSGAGYNLVCQALPSPPLESRIERDTRREGLVACPSGSVARGVSEDRTTLLCERLGASVSHERVQDEGDYLGLQVCTDAQGDYDARRFVTGVDPDRKRLLCADVEAR